MIKIGIVNGLLGNASELKVQDVEKEYDKIIVSGEHIEKAYILIRDLIIFTNKRLIFVNKQGITGKKVEYHSIIYRSITHYSVENAGKFDLDAELKIWLIGNSLPIIKKFNHKLDIFDIQKILSKHIFKN